MDTDTTNDTENTGGKGVASSDMLDAKVEDMPKNREHFQLVGRYEKGKGDWYAAGNLHKHKVDAESENSIFNYKEKKILRVILPI